MNYNAVTESTNLNNPCQKLQSYLRNHTSSPTEHPYWFPNTTEPHIVLSRLAASQRMKAAGLTPIDSFDFLPNNHPRIFTSITDLPIDHTQLPPHYDPPTTQGPLPHTITRKTTTDDDDTMSQISIQTSTALNITPSGKRQRTASTRSISTTDHHNTLHTTHATSAYIAFTTPLTTTQADIFDTLIQTNITQLIPPLTITNHIIFVPTLLNSTTKLAYIKLTSTTHDQIILSHISKHFPDCHPRIITDHTKLPPLEQPKIPLTPLHLPQCPSLPTAELPPAPTTTMVLKATSMTMKSQPQFSTPKPTDSESTATFSNHRLSTLSMPSGGTNVVRPAHQFSSLRHSLTNTAKHATSSPWPNNPPNTSQTQTTTRPLAPTNKNRNTLQQNYPKTHSSNFVRNATMVTSNDSLTTTLIPRLSTQPFSAGTSLQAQCSPTPTMMTISNYPCPVTGCKHSPNGRNRPFSTISTLIRHLHSHSHSQSQHLVDISICRSINLYCCSHHKCQNSQRRFFAHKSSLDDHNKTFHPLPTLPHPSTNHTPSLTDIIFHSLPNHHLINNWQTGITFILNNYNHDPPQFRTTWRHFLKGNNKKRFHTIHAKLIQSIIQSPTELSSPFWWLLIHLELLILAPTSKKSRNNDFINSTITHRLDDLQCGNIETLLSHAMTIKSRNTSRAPPHNDGNRAAQLAADGDNYRTAISRLCSTTPVATINEQNIPIVEGLYSDPVPPRQHKQPLPPIQAHTLPGDICNTIRHAARHKGTGINADSIDIFISLVNMNNDETNENIHHLFNLIYQGRIPHSARKFFTDTYLFCLHKDMNDLTKLRPIGIPTAIRRLMATHIAHTFRDRFGEHLLPYNYAVGIDGGMDFIIKAMQLSIEKHIITPQSTNTIPTRSALFIDLKNMFNLVSREELFDIIHTHFPELSPIATLIYEHPADVRFKWQGNSWKTIEMKEGVNQGCPLSSTFAALVMNRVIQPLDTLLQQQAQNRLNNGDTGDDGFGGISHLFAWVDDLSCTIPHIDIKFFLDNLKRLGAERGCFINPEKSRILTSCNNNSILPSLRQHHPSLAHDVEYAINNYSHQRCKQTKSLIGIELTNGFRLLGTPVGSQSFANEFFTEQLTSVTDIASTLSTRMPDLQTRLKLFNTCTVTKLPHLLGSDIMHNLPYTYDPTTWPTWNDGLLTNGLNTIITKFLTSLLDINELPEHSKLITHLDTNKGGLGLLFPSTRAIPDFVITTTISIRRAELGFRSSIDVEPTRLHPSITQLFQTSTHPSSPTLKRYNILLPMIAEIASPTKCPANNILQHFQTKLSPHSMRSRIKKYCAALLTDATYETTFRTAKEHTHLLPSILVPQTSYPLVTLNRSNPTHRLPNWSFTIGIKRKLRLPLFDPSSNPHICGCGKPHDEWGDHAFNCRKHSKKLPHNIIRDSWAAALQPALALTGYILPTTKLDIERTDIITSLPSGRPFDISFDPDIHPGYNHTTCPYSTVGADITITHSVPRPPLALTRGYTPLLSQNFKLNINPPKSEGALVLMV